MITAITSKVLNLKELDHLDKVKRNLFTVVRKHKRKLIRTKLYLNGEIKYAAKPVARWALRTVTGRFYGPKTKVDELTIAFNRLSHLIIILENSAREYLTLVKKI